MTAAADFQQAIRSGRRHGTPTLVAHFWCCREPGADALVGFSVSKAVGNSVVRHRVARKLRHIASGQLDALPPGSLLVVRATPKAAAASSTDLADDLHRAVASLLRRR